jgi:ACR3 family arsenite efflux pump ArsB
LANLGPFEAAIALTLATFGMDSNSAFAVATVQHGVQLLVVACFAGMAMVVRPRDPKPPSVSGS